MRKSKRERTKRPQARLRFEFVLAMGLALACAEACGSDANSNTPGPQGCPAGTTDCDGNCGLESWIGDTYCDVYFEEYEGNLINFNCAEHDFDGGDCPVVCPEDMVEDWAPILKAVQAA